MSGRPDDERGPGPTDAPVVRRRVVVRGRVQGVGFRASCARRAEALGLTGHVRNRPDRAVEAVFEGAAGAVEAMVAWCHDGPALARVTGVDTTDEPPEGASRFSVG